MFIDRPDAGRYEMVIDGVVAGHVRYRREGTRTDLAYLEIDPTRRGHGLGARLAAALLDVERAAGHTVVPMCSFIARYIADHPEYADLVDETARRAVSD